MGKAKTAWIDAAKGAALGTGILPGVSVGTVGLIVNVYDKLIGSIDGLRKKFVSSLLTLLPIAIGCLASAFILLFFWQKVASLYFPFIVVAALAGFVVGGIPLLWQEMKGAPWTLPDVIRLLVGLVAAALIGVFSYLSAAGVIPGLDLQAAFDAPYQNAWVFPLVLVVGFIAAIACLIPGISGSMVLFIFGLYQPVVNLYISSGDHVSIFHNQSLLVPGLLLTLTLLIGVLLGLLLVSKAMKGLLASHRRGTFSMVLGFVLGSLVSMFVNNQMYEVYHTPEVSQWWQFVVGGALFLAVGAGTYYLIAKKSKKSSNSEQIAPSEEK